MKQRHRHAAVIAATAVIIAAHTSAVLARPISGSASISHFGTPSKETVDRIRPAAAAAFREDLYYWLKEEMRIDLDTVNTVKRFTLNKLAERCLKDALERPSSRGRIWTLTLVVNESAVKSAVRAHNDHYEKLAASQWDRYNMTLESDTAAAFAAALSTISAANARVVPANTGMRIGAASQEEIRAKVQTLIDRLEVKSDIAVIEGRPGSLPSKSPVATVAIAGKPITGFPVTVFAQNGRQLGRMVSDEKGELPLRNLKVPFVHNSSMMTVSPDARVFLQANDFIRLRDVGLRLTRGQELTFIYKVPTLTYTLDYKVTTKGDDISIPQDFRTAAHIHKFLKDTCNLQQAQGGADMAIRISVEFTKTDSKETEEDALTMNASVEFKGAGINLSDKTTFDKRYPYGVTIQMGEYIWEATRTVRGLIRGTLNKIDTSQD